ncbi:MAG: alanine dehydrogenase [Burkholderiales bacterium]
MRIGVPKEIKDHEYRVAITPAGCRALTQSGHEVRVQTDAGARIGFADSDYREADATIVSRAEEVYACNLVVKVKELQPAEYSLLREGQIVFGYLHLAPNPELLRAMLDAKGIAIAYETVSDASGRLPLLIPMSQIAGRLAPQMGALGLTMTNGGSGVLLSGLPGVSPAKVTVIGAGTVGANAALIALGMGAEVTVLDRNEQRLRELEGRIKTRVTDASTLEAAVLESDMVIGALHVPGKLTPKIISRKLVAAMRRGSVIVDVAIDQGGISETSRPSSHSQPFYSEEGVVHYCVSNMPAACARTATLALTHATFPYIQAVANKGWEAALHDDPGLKHGLQIDRGRIAHQGLAEAAASR